jgi:CheY-like chemotaxis protein
MSGRALNILLAEDNPDHAELTRRSLEPWPSAHVLIHVEDGEAALDYLYGRHRFADRGRYPAPDLVLLDMRLPRLDGLEVLRQVKSDTALRHMPVVMLTSSDAERDVAAAFAYHASGFMTKPVDYTRLAELMNQLGLRQGVKLPGPKTGDGDP